MNIFILKIYLKKLDFSASFVVNLQKKLFWRWAINLIKKSIYTKNLKDMKDVTENVMTMVNRILLLCFNNMAIVDGVVKFKAKYVSLKAMRDAANVIAQLLFATTHGVTLNKGKKKESAAVKSYVIAQVLKSHAHETGDLDLEELMTKSISYIRGIRDSEFWDFGKMVYDLSLIHI